MSFIISAGRGISQGLGHDTLVVLESTVYPGVTDEVLRPVLEESGLKAGTDFGLSYCPERYNPGDAAHGILDIVRVVGGFTPHWTEITAQLYKNNAKDVVTVKDIKTAVAAKIIENIQRDLNIALMNELALISERLQCVQACLNHDLLLAVVSLLPIHRLKDLSPFNRFRSALQASFAKHETVR